MVCGLKPDCSISRVVKNACNVAASPVMTDRLRDRDALQGFPGGRWRRRGVRRCRSDTSYSDLGITGITPVLGLFRSPLLPARKWPGTLADALWQLSPVRIIRCAHGITSSP